MNSSDAYKLMHAGTLALCRAEQQGIRVDVEYCERKKEFLTKKIGYLEGKLKETQFFLDWQKGVRGVVNIYSGKQLGDYLYKSLRIDPATLTKNGQGATDEDALLELNIPALSDLIEIRKLKKIRDTYLDAFIREQVNGFMHPFFNLHIPKTFRSSSDSPNFQNFPIRNKEAMKIVRKALFPRKGNQLLEVDYSGLEVRIAACYHKDPTMLKYINDPTSDMHKDMAQQIFKIKSFDKSIPEFSVLRAASKNGFVFPEFYGDYYKNCAVNMACGWQKLPHGVWKSGQGLPFLDGHISDHLINNGINSLSKFTDHIKEIEDHFWNERFRVYKKWKESWFFDYQKKGYFDTLTGFRCTAPMFKNDAINYPVQGSAFHCLLWVFIYLDSKFRAEGYLSKLIGQIHDSIVIDVVPEELERVSKIVYEATCIKLPQAWNWIIVPLDVEAKLGGVDASWADLEPYKLRT